MAFSVVGGYSFHFQYHFSTQFATDLGFTIVSVEDLGDGIERVYVRSNAGFANHGRQYFRLMVSEP